MGLITAAAALAGCADQPDGSLEVARRAARSAAVGVCEPRPVDPALRYPFETIDWGGDHLSCDDEGGRRCQNDWEVTGLYPCQ